MKREIEVLVKNIRETAVVCICFQFNWTFSLKSRFFKYTFETQPACVS